MGGLLDGIASTADHLAGSMDESVARTFDDQEGGGVIDGLEEATVGTAADVVTDDDPNDGIDLGQWFNSVVPGTPASYDPDNQTTHEGEEDGGWLDVTAEEAHNPLIEVAMSNPALGLVMALALIYVLGQLFDVQVSVGGGS